MRLLTALFLACAVRAEAEPHVLVVRVSQGMRTYSHTMTVEEGNQENFVGRPDGGGDKNMVVNTVVVRSGDKFGVELQAELSYADKSRSFQVQTSLEMRVGRRMTVVECGDWTVEAVLDGKPGRSAPATAAWSAEGLDDYRLTLDLATSGGRRRCRQVLRGQTQSNIVDSTMKNGRRDGFILNASLPEPRGGGFDLQYQIEQSPLQMQSRTTLTLGRKTTAPAGGGRIDFLLEGALPAAAASASAAQSSAESGTVPLLR